MNKKGKKNDAVHAYINIKNHGTYHYLHFKDSGENFVGVKLGSY